MLCHSTLFLLPMIKRTSQTCCSAVTRWDPLAGVHWISVVCRVLDAYDRPETTDFGTTKCMTLWPPVPSFAAVTKLTGMRHLFQRGRQPRSSYSPTRSTTSRKLANCILSREARSNQITGSVYQERIETVLFLPTVLHKNCSNHDTPIRDTSCQLSLVSWLASGLHTAVYWPRSLKPADAACEEMGDRKGLDSLSSPHIEPPTPTSREIRKPGCWTAQTLRHTCIHV